MSGASVSGGLGLGGASVSGGLGLGARSCGLPLPSRRPDFGSPVLCHRSSNAAFHEALREIEKRPACGGLPMISFLILPMQRVTRLPLLTDVSTQRGPRPGREVGRTPGRSCPGPLSSGVEHGTPPSPPRHSVVRWL